MKLTCPFNLDGEVGKPSLPRRALSRARNPLKPVHRETNDLTILFFCSCFLFCYMIICSPLRCCVMSPRFF